MRLSPAFVRDLVPVHPKELIDFLKRDNRPSFDDPWTLKNEIRPVDIYCYFGARFGAPNGIQNLLRGDHTDNLVHWEWTLRSEGRVVKVQGLNFRTEVWVSGESLSESDREQFIHQLKEAFSTVGAAMGQVRKSLEQWIEFVNPYQRIRRSVTTLMDDIAALGLDTERDSVPDFWEFQDRQDVKKRWDEQMDKYNRAIGLCFGVRSMLPVMAEAFVNLLLYVLMKPDIKKDERLRENVIRQPIDIRIRGLGHNCSGFRQHIDYSSAPCKRYHTLVNERNDLLHGNIVIEKLRFNELYFNGKVPVFTRYSSMWERSFGVAHRSVGLDSVKAELTIVNDLIEYLLSCLEETIQDRVRFMSEKFDLGICLDDGRLGVLFADWLVDFALGPKHAD